MRPGPTLRFLFAIGVSSCALWALTACSPNFNWRDVRPENTRLSLLMPCKPDKAQKTVPLGTQPTELTLLGCNAGGAMFAVAVADVGDVALVKPVLDQWAKVTLINMKASTVETANSVLQAHALPLKLQGAATQPPPILVSAQGQRADGTAVRGQAAYFSQGSQVFQVVLYADTLPPEISEAFFASLKFE